MNLLYYNNEEEYINYKAKLDNHENETTIIFFHGFLSNMESKKAYFIETFCIENNINYIVFDYYAHGKSSGTLDDLTFEKALFSCLEVIDNLVKKDCIIIGSSFGCWLATHLTLLRNNKIKGLIFIAPAIDFTLFVPNNPNKFIYNFEGDLIKQTDIGNFVIKKKLLDSTNNYLFSNKDELININVPIRILQGTMDASIQYKNTLELIEKFSTDDLECVLIKNEIHSFSSEKCLKILKNKIIELYY